MPMCSPRRVAMTQDRFRVSEAMYRGEDSQGRPFTVTAGSAVQSRANEPVVRMERLVALVQRRARERGERFVGRTMEVLVEGPSRTDPARRRGRRRCHATVVVMRMPVVTKTSRNSSSTGGVETTDAT